MKALVQRVSRGSVVIGNETVASIGPGFVVLLGVGQNDTDEDAEYLAGRTANLRVFQDGNGKMNLSLLDTAGQVLVVSQFTLYADTRKGNRPSFVQAAPPETAERLYSLYASHLRRILGEGRVSTGVFRAEMSVEIINDGPVTIELVSDR